MTEKQDYLVTTEVQYDRYFTRTIYVVVQDVEDTTDALNIAIGYWHSREIDLSQSTISVTNMTHIAKIKI